jgi:hypothetical protein
MTPTILTCPHCGAGLPVTRFASIVVCKYCESTVRVDPSAVSARKYREAWAEWNSAPANVDARLFSIADTHWTAQRLLARGEISDVYLAKRARRPSELVVFKVLRDCGDAPLLQAEWRALDALRAHTEAKRIDLGSRVPRPVVSGSLTDADGSLACAYRWASGFVHTFESVREVHKNGIAPVASIWVWRRILEILAVLHEAKLVHGAVLPNHLLVENGEHGVRLVGFSCADAPNVPLRIVSTQFENFYPADALDSRKLTAAADIAMSARCISHLLGGGDVPGELAELLHRVGEKRSDLNAWALHKQLGELGRSLFGPPAFHPILMT